MDENDSKQALQLQALSGKIDLTLHSLGEIRAQCLQLEQSVSGMDSRIAGILKLDAVADADMQQRFTAQNTRLEELEAKLIDTKALTHEISANLRLASADVVKLRSDFDQTSSAAQAQFNSIKSELAAQRSTLELLQADWTAKHRELERKVLRQRLVILAFVLIMVLSFVILRWRMGM